NELDWFAKSGREWGLFNEAWKHPPEHTAKRAWLAHIEAEVKSPAEFERGWGVKVATLAELADHREPVAPRTEAARQVAASFVREVARRYFEVATSAVRAHDPNHLVFGCRFAQAAPDVWDIAGQYCDVISVNQYPVADLERGIPDYLVERLAGWHRK